MTHAVEVPVVDVDAAYRSLAERLEEIVRFDVRASDVVIEDACQFAWSRLVLHAGRVAPESALSWLSRTAIREAVKLLRRDDRELSLEAGAEEADESSDGHTWEVSATADPRPLPQEHAEQLERLALVARLPERQQR